MNVFNGKVLYSNDNNGIYKKFLDSIINNEIIETIKFPPCGKRFIGDYILMLYQNSNSYTSVKEIIIDDNFESITPDTNNGSFPIYKQIKWNFQNLEKVIIGKNLNIGNCTFSFRNQSNPIIFEVSLENPYIKGQGQFLLSKDGKILYGASKMGTGKKDLSNLTDCEVLKYCLFSYNQFSEIILPPNSKVIEEGCFSSSNNVIKIQLPQSCERLGKEAFGGCNSLQEIFIPNNVNLISQDCFRGILNLKFYTPTGNKNRLKTMLENSGYINPIIIEQ